MAIVKNLSITVNGNKSSISKPIYLYLGDGAITLLINILEKNYVIGTVDSSNNLVEATNTEYARVCILKSNNELVYSDRCPVVEGKIKFIIEKEFIDEIAEAGEHLLQIHLYDAEVDGNRYTIPPVSISLLKPICDIGHDSNTP